MLMGTGHPWVVFSSSKAVGEGQGRCSDSALQVEPDRTGSRFRRVVFELRHVAGLLNLSFALSRQFHAHLIITYPAGLWFL